MYLSIHSALFVVLTLGVAYVMMLAGVQKSALQWKRSRVCPSCGLEERRCRCRRRKDPAKNV
jgi:hypothetical protein